MGRLSVHSFPGLKCRILGVQLYAIISGKFDAAQPVGTNRVMNAARQEKVLMLS